VQTLASAALHELPIRRGALVSQFWGGDAGRQNALVLPRVAERRRQGNATIQAAKSDRSDRMSRKIVELQEVCGGPQTLFLAASFLYNAASVCLVTMGLLLVMVVCESTG
jgi:hypothetical protein